MDLMGRDEDEIFQTDFSLKAPLGKFIVVKYDRSGYGPDEIIGEPVDSLEEGLEIADSLQPHLPFSRFVYQVRNGSGAIMVYGHLDIYVDPG